MADTLPPELLRAVFSHVQDKAHLLALSTVSRKFRSLVFSRLFEVLTIRQHDEHDLWCLKSYPYFHKDSIARVTNVLEAVRELVFRAPFDDTGPVRLDRCFHFYDERMRTLLTDTPRSGAGFHPQDEGDIRMREQGFGEDEEELYHSESGDYGRMELAKKICQLLSALPDNHLTSFSWDMGTCFPSAILGKEGYLVAHQNYIRKLSLITPLNCTCLGPALEQFANLQELSWKGLATELDFSILREFLDVHHERLTSLELDFVNWAEVEKGDGLSDDSDDSDFDVESTPLLELILPERRDAHQILLLNLLTISLSAASLKGSFDQLIEAFNLRNVSELRILNCKVTMLLLEYMALKNIPLRVIRAELLLSSPGLDGMTDEFIDFLAPFRSLEDLFVLFESFYADQHYVDSIYAHRSTLRRLVYHRRQYCLEEKAPYFEEYCDNSLEEVSGLEKILQENRLESLGLCAEPLMLQKTFRDIARHVYSLELLHLRFTGKAERKPRFLKNDADYEGDEPSERWTRARQTAIENGTTPPPRSPGPTEEEIRETWEQIQGRNWREDEEKELEAFANWAFGPDGFPYLRVLASGDFSHGNRFADSRTLWCRKTRGSTRRAKWRPVEREDVLENELIDGNIDMLSACPVSPLYYSYGRDDKFPGIS